MSTVRFSDTIPYDAPERLEDLVRPLEGVVTVGPHIDTSRRPSYDLSDPGQVRSLYTRVVRDGTAADQTRLLAARQLIALWPELLLPARCRAEWEARFEHLAARR